MELWEFVRKQWIYCFSEQLRFIVAFSVLIDLMRRHLLLDDDALETRIRGSHVGHSAYADRSCCEIDHEDVNAARREVGERHGCASANWSRESKVHGVTVNEYRRGRWSCHVLDVLRAPFLLGSLVPLLTPCLLPRLSGVPLSSNIRLYAHVPVACLRLSFLPSFFPPRHEARKRCFTRKRASGGLDRRSKSAWFELEDFCVYIRVTWRDAHQRVVRRER